MYDDSDVTLVWSRVGVCTRTCNLRGFALCRSGCQREYSSVCKVRAKTITREKRGRYLICATLTTWRRVTFITAIMQYNNTAMYQTAAVATDELAPLNFAGLACVAWDVMTVTIIIINIIYLFVSNHAITF